MKKLFLFCIAIICGATAFAQNIDSPVSAQNIGPVKTTAGDDMLPTNDVMQNIEFSKELSSFYNFVKVANLFETYKTKGPITVFAPINEAFNNLSAGKLDSLNKPAYVWELTEILTYHTVSGYLSAKDIEKLIKKYKGTTTFTTLNGAKLTAKIDANRNIVLEDENGGQSIISRFDIKQNNGMIHIINKVLLPKPKTI